MRPARTEKKSRPISKQRRWKIAGREVIVRFSICSNDGYTVTCDVTENGSKFFDPEQHGSSASARVGDIFCDRDVTQTLESRTLCFPMKLR